MAINAITNKTNILSYAKKLHKSLSSKSSVSPITKSDDNITIRLWSNTTNYTIFIYTTTTRTRKLGDVVMTGFGKRSIRTNVDDNDSINTLVKMIEHD